MRTDTGYGADGDPVEAGVAVVDGLVDGEAGELVAGVVVGEADGVAGAVEVAPEELADGEVGDEDGDWD
ncbi:MAG TPA: hypothetical protein VFQ68_27135 [Streptosporangiaceae bacterium]|nr:hypothetical protein [Streptosporangiaceae bacterium]